MEEETFLREIEDCTHESWDHYTHLRLAWLVLKRMGRRKGSAKIQQMIKNFIEKSPRTNGKTFHLTMTYFWIHMIDFAMNTVNEKGKDDWKTFLLLNPHLANGGLFLHYYSKKLMLQTAESREQVLSFFCSFLRLRLPLQVVLPDKLPLPSVISDIEALKKKNSKNDNNAVAVNEPLSTEVFMLNVRNGKAAQWGHKGK